MAEAECKLWRMELSDTELLPWEGGGALAQLGLPLDPWRCPRPGWMGLGAPWKVERQGNEMGCEVLSIPEHPVFL